MSSDPHSLVWFFTKSFLKRHNYNINLISWMRLISLWVQNQLYEWLVMSNTVVFAVSFWKNSFVLCFFGKPFMLGSLGCSVTVTHIHVTLAAGGETLIRFGRWADRCSSTYTPGKGQVNVRVCLGSMQDWALKEFFLGRVCLFVFVFATKARLSCTRALWQAGRAGFV